MATITLYAKQKKRHRCIEQTFGLCGRRQEWDVLREQHWNKYTLKGETDHQPRLDACPSHHRGLKCKIRKSRDTWSNRQVWFWGRKWSTAKANRVLPREDTGHSKQPLKTTQKRATHGHHQMVNAKIRLIIFLEAKDGETPYIQQKQDWELPVAQIMSFFLPNSELNWSK